MQNWEGRQWIISGSKAHDDDAVIRVLSYHVFADHYKCENIQYSSSKVWSTRKVRLLQEILSYNPSIVCLQDVDHLFDWWQPQLAQNGYAICVGQRTKFRETTEVEFVAVVYKMSEFQLFKSTIVELNNCADNLHDAANSFKDRCKTDDVGLIAFLQPWGSNKMKCALCIVSAMLADRDVDFDVRKQQTEYLTRQIEIANKEFQLPVIIGVSMHDVPTSGAYHILRTGRTILEPKAPKKCPIPKVFPICRGSVRLRWYPPPSTFTDPPVQEYRISWCPGASKTLSFKAHMDVSAGDCIQYVDKPDHKGQIRSVALEELSYVVAGLSSEIPYEFRVSAINRVGEGLCSDSSLPISLINPPKVF